MASEPPLGAGAADEDAGVDDEVLGSGGPYPPYAWPQTTGINERATASLNIV